MASLLSDDEDLSGGAPTSTTTASGSGDPGASKSGSSTATPTAVTASAPSATNLANQQDVAAIQTANQGADYSPLLNYVGNEGTTAKNAVTSGGTDFNTALGSFSPFGQTDQDALSAVINGQSPLATGRAMLAKTYGGPTTANNSTYDPLVATYQTDANSTGNLDGMQSLLQTMSPALTPGQRQFDSAAWFGQPGYQSGSADLIKDAADTGLKASGNTTAENTAMSQRKSDIGAYNTAGQGFVNSQVGALRTALDNQIGKAQASDLAIQNAPLTQKSQTFTVDPKSYGLPEDESAGYAPYAFNQTVDPAAYASFTPGGIATRGNVATPEQISQYNLAQQLLNSNDQLTGSTRTAASQGFNQQAFAAALAQAQAQRDAIEQQDKAWLAAHPKQAARQETLNSGGGSEGGMGGGGDPSGDTGSGEGGDGGDGEGGGSSDAEGGDAAGEGGDGNGGAGEAGGEGGEGGGEGGGDSFAKGGLVRSKPAFKLPGASSGPPQPNINPNGISQPQTAASMDATSMGNSAPLAQALARGGYLPPGTGPAGRDTIPAHLNNGEFVTRAPTVRAVGPDNMAALNQLNQMPPPQQHAVKTALHQALGRAIGAHQNDLHHAIAAHGNLGRSLGQ